MRDVQQSRVTSDVLGLQGFWILGLLAAWLLKMATAQQMLANGVKKGMPYVWHLGMWNDLVTVHPWCAMVVGMYVFWWTSLAWGSLAITVFAISLYVSYIANRDWVKPLDIIQSHAGIADDKVHSTGTMSVVGWIHVPHMSIIVTVIVLFVISAIRGLVPWPVIVGSTFLLLAHACIGQHGILRELNPAFNPWPHQWFDAAVLVLSAVFMAAGLYFLFSYFVERAA